MPASGWGLDVQPRYDTLRLINGPAALNLRASLASGCTIVPVAAPVPSGIRVSFEFFPPKTEKMEQTLWACIERLAMLEPAYVSVTYGAGGSTRERTHATVARIRQETRLEPAAHLTCIGANCKTIDSVAETYWEAGIRHIVALRGDPPARRA